LAFLSWKDAVRHGVLAVPLIGGVASEGLAAIVMLPLEELVVWAE